MSAAGIAWLTPAQEVDLEWGCASEVRAAPRLQFVLDFAYTTGLRISKLVDARLAQFGLDGHGTAGISAVRQWTVRKQSR